MTSAFVTGATGFVGRHLVRELRDAGWRVTTAGLRGPADVAGDLQSIPLPRQRFDVVFHLAGFSSPRKSVEQPAACFDANAATTSRLARELRAGRFVLASSSKVYAPSAGPVTETSPLLPSNPYAASKLCAEALAFAGARDAVVLRPYNHIGPGQSDDFVCPAVAKQIVRAEAGVEPPEVRVRNWSPRIDFFDVRDMARAYRLAAERGARGEVYNVATGRPVRVADVVRSLAALARIPLRVHGEDGPEDLSTGDASKFRRATGWAPAIPLAKTLADLLDHERAAAAPKRAARA